MYRARIMREFICFYLLSMYNILVKSIYNIQNSRPRYFSHSHNILTWYQSKVANFSSLKFFFVFSVSEVPLVSFGQVCVDPCCTQPQPFFSVFLWLSWVNFLLEFFFLVHPFVSGFIYFLWISHLCVLSLQPQIILPGHFSFNFFSREKTFGVILMARMLKNHPLLKNLGCWVFSFMGCA